MSRNAAPVSHPPRADRRVQRTRRRLKEALLQLIEERGYDDITIEAITERADVGRSTFYSHFTSKEELLFDGFAVALRALAGRVPPDGHPGFRFSLPLLQHVGSQKRFALAVLGGNASPGVQRTITEILADVVRAELERLAPSRGPTREAEVAGVVGAFRGLVTWWLTSGKGMSAEALDRQFQRWGRPHPS